MHKFIPQEFKEILRVASCPRHACSVSVHQRAENSYSIGTIVQVIHLSRKGISRVDRLNSGCTTVVTLYI